MKRLTTILATALMLALFTGSALAAATATVDVTATVLASCSFDTAGTTIAFGAIDPTAGDQAASGTLNYTCTTGASPISIDLAAGPYAMTGVVLGDSLTYALASAYVHNAAADTGVVTIDADILAADMLTVSADDYSDSQTITINY